MGELQEVVFLKGEIRKGDLQKIKKAASQLLKSSKENTFTLLLDSTGGDVLEAIEIGRFLRSVLASAVVSGKEVYDPETELGKFVSDNGTIGEIFFKRKSDKIENYELPRCHSACVLILAGAVIRNVRDSIDYRKVSRINESPIGKMEYIYSIGLHRPYFIREHFKNLSTADADKQYRELEALTKSYMAEMGLSQSFIDRIFVTRSADVDLISSEEFYKHVPSTASYLDEWLIAKCGNYGAREALTPKEFEVFNAAKLAFEKFREKNNTISYIDARRNFKISEGQTLGTYDKKIIEHRRNVDLCKVRSIAKSQREKLVELVTN